MTLYFTQCPHIVLNDPRVYCMIPGMFVYAKGSKERPINEEAMAIIKQHSTVGAAAVGSDEDIALRLLTRY